MLIEIFLVLILIGIIILIACVFKLIMQSQRERGRFDVISKDLGDMNKQLQDFYQDLGKMLEVSSDVKKFSMDFRKFFSGSTVRGPLGEELLKDMLSQVLPRENYSTKYSFSSGRIVDAIIRIEQGIIPIDSKFPLDNYRLMIDSEDEKNKESYKKLFIKNVEKHITEINSKYIIPSEGTLDFALMYVPSEPVFAEIISSKRINETARKKNVIVVSPQSLYCYLQTIIFGLKGKRIQENIKQIMGVLGTLQHDSRELEDLLETLNKHITNAHRKMGDARDKHRRINQKIESINMLDEDST